MAPDRPHSSFLNPLVIAISVAGFVLAVLGLWEHVIHSHGLATGPSFCNVSAHINCEKVNTSEWSVFFGVPVAAYGMFFYFMTFMLASGSQRGTPMIKGLLAFSSVVATVVSISLFLISELIIGALCLLCVGTYILSFALLITVLGAAYRWNIGAFLSAAFNGPVDLINGFFGRASSELSTYSRLLLAIALVAFGVATSSSKFFLMLAQADGSHRQAAEAVLAWQTSPVAILPTQHATGLMGDHVKGDPNAPISIVEFADFQCGGCRVAHQEIKPLLEDYAGKYSFAFKQFPLDMACNQSIPRPFHRHACLASHFSRCAGEQGRFWEALDMLFTSKLIGSDLALDQAKESLITEGSADLELDSEAMRECINSARHAGKINEDIALGVKLDIPGTPTFYVNGRRIQDRSPKALKAIFDFILKSAPEASAQ